MSQKELEEAVERYFQHLREFGLEDQDSDHKDEILDAALKFVKGPDVGNEIMALMDARDARDE